MPQFENEILSVSLPAGWLDQSEGDLLSFACPQTNEELTISLGQFKQQVAAGQLSEILWQLIQHKASALGQISGGTFQVLDVAKPDPSVPYTAYFSGHDSRNSVYSKTLITGHPTHFVSVSYYLRDCGQVSPDVALRADGIIGMWHDKAAA